MQIFTNLLYHITCSIRLIIPQLSALKDALISPCKKGSLKAGAIPFQGLNSITFVEDIRKFRDQAPGFMDFYTLFMQNWQESLKYFSQSTYLKYC